MTVIINVNIFILIIFILIKYKYNNACVKHSEATDDFSRIKFHYNNDNYK